MAADKKKVLIRTASWYWEKVRLLEENGIEVKRIPDGIEDLCDAEVRDAHAVVPGLAMITRAMMEKSPRLLIIAAHGVGYNNVDLEAANELGILATNIPGANSDAVAEFAFGILGVAITIIVGQLPRLLGVPGSSGSVADQLRSLAGHLSETDPLTMVIGVGALVLILGLRVVDRRIPGAFVAMVLGIGLVTALGLAQQGVAVVGEVATVMPSLGLPHIGLGDLTYLVTGAAGIVFLAVGESLGAARSFAVRHRDAIDGDQELVALGAANLSSGLFGGFIVDASLSQSATAEAAGARSQLSGLVTAGLVLATALLLAPLFESLPWAVLAAIVIASVLGIVDLDELRRYWAWRRADAILAVAALIGVATHRRPAGAPHRRAAVPAHAPAACQPAGRREPGSPARRPGAVRGPRAQSGGRSHPGHRGGPPRCTPLLLQRERLPGSDRGARGRGAGDTPRRGPRPRRHVGPGRDHHRHAGPAPR